MLKDGLQIVFAGDSTTDAGRTGGACGGMGDGYVRLVQYYLQAFYPQYTIGVVNAGVSGNTSRDLLARWDRDVMQIRPAPDVIFCMIGINDVWRQFDSVWLDKNQYVYEQEYEKNLCEMCEKSKDVPEFFMMSPFYMESVQQDKMLVLTKRYAAISRRVAEKYGRKFIDTQAAFDAYMRYRSGQTISWDRVHPFGCGTVILQKCVIDALEG